jgi:hypothetical protein
MHQPFAFPDLPQRFETSARCTFGAAYINLRVMGPLKAGVPLITYQGGAPLDSDGYRDLRICTGLISAARDLGDPQAIAALAMYPRIAAILDAALAAVSRDAALVSAIDKAREASSSEGSSRPKADSPSSAGDRPTSEAQHG